MSNFTAKSDWYFEGSWECAFFTFDLKRSASLDLHLAITKFSQDKFSVLLNKYMPVARTPDTPFLTINWASYNLPEWGQEEYTPSSPKCMHTSMKRVVSRASPNYSMLTQEQLFAFRTQGYLIVRDAVCALSISNARRAIYSDIGANGLPVGDLLTFNSQSYVPLLRADTNGACSPLTDVFDVSLVGSLMKNLIGRPMHPDGAPQVAIRFPTHPLQDWQTPRISNVHIDGIATPNNGLSLETNCLDSFTALVGVALSDQTGPFQGNLVVYPGSHLRMVEFFQTQWTHQVHDGIPEAECVLGPYGEGYGDWGGSSVPPGIIDDISPVHVNLRRGDLVICHYQLAHAFSENRSDEPRVNLYYRVKAEDHTNKSLLNLWECYDSIVD